jgi:hypothetical protein
LHFAEVLLILGGGEVWRFHDPALPYLDPKDVDIAGADLQRAAHQVGSVSPWISERIDAGLIRE